VSRVSLLDVNVLVSLFDPDHVHHQIAHDWFADARRTGWATCPLTEAGFVRILTNPRFLGEPLSLAEAVDRLRAFRSSGHHHWWDRGVSLSDTAIFRATAVRGHRQVTDVYLAGLAHAHKGRLATFDRGIPVAAIAGAAPSLLEVIAADEE
jgi:toxin-antitoxin system PIN domain toxin